MRKPNVIISACLYGEAVRYDCQAKLLPAAVLSQLKLQYHLIPLCPECLGGLPVPRPPAEIIAGSGIDVLQGGAQVCTASGQDVTAAFVAGAKAVLSQAREHQVNLAILKAKSPSCGAGRHYDGSFSTCLRSGDGVTAALLKSHDIKVITEEDL